MPFIAFVAFGEHALCCFSSEFSGTGTVKVLKVYIAIIKSIPRPSINLVDNSGFSFLYKLVHVV